ncbi:MAG TPA: metallophosphoesterase [Kofleriaceae bacterium]|nr:metallophosphoesterase [Kofleriaceae bacterium]
MRALVCLIGCALGGAIACDRGRTPEPSPAPPAPSPASAVARCTITPLPLRLPAPRRTVAIGDLHGDLGATRAALRAAGAIDERDRWAGGDLVVVQTGDVLDRGDDERAILDLIARLESEARVAGGAFVLLLGNHELMNGAGDFRYVTPAGAHDFDGAAGSRLAALGAGGPYARRLAAHAVIAIVGDTVFSHAGVLGGWASRVDEVNQGARCWLDGQTRDPPAALTSDDGPVWTRAAGSDGVDCAAVRTALAALHARRMVIGHTVQPGGITSACDDALWRIDVGLSRAYGGPIQVLELAAGTPPRIVTGTR